MTFDFELKRYAYAFSNFFLQHIGDGWARGINSVILFGSVAQGRASEKSDVDMFFDVSLSKSKSAEFRRILLRMKDEFLLTGEGLSFKAKKCTMT